MRAKNSKTTNGNPELIEALEAIAREKDISKEVLSFGSLQRPVW